MIAQTTQWPSPAKLNLFLYINGKLSSGYHELQTLFQFLDHGDTLSILANHSGEISLSPAIPGVSLEENLIWKAANALKQATGCPFGAHIELEKILPMGGGIGGGSSNAATTLVALNHLWQTQLSDDELAALALPLGADVPVFVRGFAAFAEGVGEQLTPTEPDEKWYLVVRPNVSISTAEIFQHPNLTRDTAKLPLDFILSQPYVNDCEKIVRMLYPEVDKQLSWLLQYAPSRLTGTGSCIFAEFESRSKAESLYTRLPDTVSAFVAQGRNLSPLTQRLAEYQSAHNHSI